VMWAFNRRPHRVVSPTTKSVRCPNPGPKSAATHATTTNPKPQKRSASEAFFQMTVKGHRPIMRISTAPSEEARTRLTGAMVWNSFPQGRGAAPHVLFDPKDKPMPRPWPGRCTGSAPGHKEHATETGPTRSAPHWVRIRRDPKASRPRPHPTPPPVSSPLTKCRCRSLPAALPSATDDSRSHRPA